MFMLKALLHLVITGIIAAYTILGYQYQVEGYGLHPLICIAVCLVMTIAAIFMSELPVMRFKARPKG